MFRMWCDLFLFCNNFQYSNYKCEIIQNVSYNIVRRRLGWMDPYVGWYQPEQEGPAKRLWLRIWETQSETDKMNLKNLENANPNVNKAPDFIPLNEVNGESRNNNYFNPTRRKANDNRASTFNLNQNHDALIGEYGGCPWRVPNYNYKPGILGWVPLGALSALTGGPAPRDSAPADIGAAGARRVQVHLHLCLQFISLLRVAPNHTSIFWL